MSSKLFTAADVAGHNTEASCWVSIDGKVYDVTSFIAVHPGGASILLEKGGRDVSREFKMFHKHVVLEKYGPRMCVGALAAVAAVAAPVGVGGSEAAGGGEFPFVADTAGLAGSEAQSWNSGGTAGELPRERAGASFDVVNMMHVLDGGPEGTERRRYICSPLKAIDTDDKHNMTREEMMSKHFDEFISMHKAAIMNGFRPKNKDGAWMGQYSTITGSLLTHLGLFVPCIMSQGSSDQVAAWLPRAMTFKIVGSYAQTELGHGSNVRGIGTVATYDAASQSFIMNTPTLSSMKWWISNIAVYAQLEIGSKNYGVHVFFVQLRDEEHRMLPGIEVGDLGPKFGDAAIDTGYLRMKNVRIPREHMLCKRQHVEPDGTYVVHRGEGQEKAKGAEKLHYVVMMMARAGMVHGGGGKLAAAATVAARYSCVRRQGFVASDAGVSFRAPERKIIDYQMQSYRVFKGIATAYVLKLMGFALSERLAKFAAIVAKGDVVPEGINELHATTAGLKGLCTFIAAEGIEDLRKACGGHGYATNSGIAGIMPDYAWRVTAEGDYIVMLLQTARFLVKSVDDARAGAPLPGLISYLEVLRDRDFDVSKARRVPDATTTAGVCDLSYLLDLYRTRALVSVVFGATRVGEEVARGASFTDALNTCALTCVATARSHVFYFIVKTLVEFVSEVSDPACAAVLRRLVSLFAMIHIAEGAQWIGIVGPAHAAIIDDAISETLLALRRDAVPLVDAFEFPDNVLGSTIGRADGNVYEALYEAATKSRLNRVQPFAGYRAHLRPHLDIDFLKLRNTVDPALLPESKL